MMKGRNLVVLIGIPSWLFLIWKGDLYYSIFILICMALALGEFYSLMEEKGAKPLRWMGMAATVFIADYYYVQPAITPHEMLGGIILIIILTCIWELFQKAWVPLVVLSLRNQKSPNISGIKLPLLFLRLLYLQLLLQE